MAVVNNYQEPSPIDYRILSAGLNHYEALGYPYMEVPWAVSKEAIDVTLPIDRKANTLTYGALVGSGEQGFIELLLRGETILKASTITPCFRDEAVYDELHHAYFMKLELIDTDATKDNLNKMINNALSFFSQYCEVAVVETGPDMFDIIDRQRKVELGSYGFRSFNNITFIYGTGVALPRVSTVLKKLNLR